MGLLERIANYFKEWDGEDKTAPKMELSIEELRNIASMHTELCRVQAENRYLKENLVNKQDVICDVISKILPCGSLCVEWDYGMSREEIAESVLNQAQEQFIDILEKMKVS